MEAALIGPTGRIALSSSVLTIGRVAGNALVVQDAKASSRHAEIRPEGQGYSIVDLGSTNGTFVNEQRIAANTPQMLNASDSIRIGDTRFTFEALVATQSATVFDNPAPQQNNPAYLPTVAAAPPPYMPPPPAQQAPPAVPPPAYPLAPNQNAELSADDGGSPALFELPGRPGATTSRASSCLFTIQPGTIVLPTLWAIIV